MSQHAGTRIGRRLSDVIAEREARDPAFALAGEVAAPGIAVANAVTLARAQSNMTQAELAAMIGTTDSAVSRLESGRHVPNLETLRKLSDALGVTFDFHVRPDRQVETEVSLREVGTPQSPARSGAHLVVTPGPVSGTWTVRRARAVIMTESTQARAIEYARRALRTRGGLLETHRATGELREVREVRPAREMRAQSG